MIKNRYEEQQKNHKLDKFDKAKVVAARRMLTPKNIARLLGIIDKLCRSCRAKFYADTTRPVDDYCPICKKMMLEAFEK